ncbi:MAG: ABC transporter ATP-binding protein [Fibrobacteres bacterium]|nr:ABC transporter ATP-binding protein [Fibrobacterota bacterium]
MSHVVLNKLCKTFGGGLFVVRDLNLNIKDGEFLTLLGPSGCGKSTTLNMIAGLETISSGELFIGDKLYNDIPARKRNIGMVFQSYALFPHMTVDQNIAFGLKLKKMSRIDIFDKLEWAKSLLHLEDKGRRFPKELSGGERQRVALGRALVLNPQVLLLDEPLSNLDQELRETMTTEIKRIHLSVGCTTVYVTHNQMEAMRMSDRIAVMRDSRLMQCASPMTIFNYPANRFTAGFIGSPAMNMFEAQIVEFEGGAGVKIGDINMRLPKERSEALVTEIGRKVTAGVRPQQIFHFKDSHGRRHSDTEVLVKIQFVEPLGDRIMATAKFQGQDFLFFIMADKPPAKGEEVGAVIDGRHIHLFDKDGGDRISIGEKLPDV